MVIVGLHKNSLKIGGSKIKSFIMNILSTAHKLTDSAHISVNPQLLNQLLVIFLFEEIQPSIHILI